LKSINYFIKHLLLVTKRSDSNWNQKKSLRCAQSWTSKHHAKHFEIKPSKALLYTKIEGLEQHLNMRYHNWRKRLRCARAWYTKKSKKIAVCCLISSCQSLEKSKGLFFITGVKVKFALFILIVAYPLITLFLVVFDKNLVSIVSSMKLGSR